MLSAVALVPLAATGSNAATVTPTTLQMQPAGGGDTLAITYANRQITVKGTLQASAGGGSLRGIGGKPITLTDYLTGVAGGWGDPVSLGTATTASDGTFSLTASVPGPGYVTADFAGDTTFGSSNWSVPVGAVEHLPTRITMDPLGPVTAGSTLKFSGLVEMQAPDGVWVPAQGAVAEPTNGTWLGGAWGKLVDANGRFSFGLPGLGTNNIGPAWGVATETTPFSFASAAQSALTDVTVNPAQTRITGFSAGPQPATAQDGLSFSGHVDAMIDGQWQPWAQQVSLYFRPKGSTTWINRYTYALDAKGDFSIDRVPAYFWNGKVQELAVGSWQIRTENSGKLWLPASSDIKTIDLHVKTVIGSLYIRHWGPRSGRRTLTGALSIRPGPAIHNDVSTALPGQTVTIYYRARGSKTWHSVAVVTTQKNGAFTYTLTSRPHGYYRATFGRSAPFDAATSPSVYFAD